MPQMAPLMWTTLFFTFSTLLLMVIIKVTYSHTPFNLSELSDMPTTHTSSKQNTTMNWNW